MRFRQFIESVVGIRASIQELLTKCLQLPDTDKDEELFGEKNYKDVMVSFYQDVLKNMDDQLTARIMQSGVNLGDDPYKVFRSLNSEEHPVRNYMILKANKML